MSDLDHVGQTAIRAAEEIERLRRIEAAARVQWEAYGAYPGLIAALKEKRLGA